MSSQQLYCTRCGTLAVPGERFCGECGNNLTLPGSTSATPPNQNQPPSSQPFGANLPPNQGQPFNQSQPLNQPGYNQPSGYQAPPNFQANQQARPATPPPVYNATSYQQTSQTKRSGGGSGALIVGGLVLLLLLGGGGYFVYQNANGNKAVVNLTATAGISLNNDATATRGSSLGNDATATSAISLNFDTATPEISGLPTDTPIADNGSSNGDAKTILENAAAQMRLLNSYHLKVDSTYQNKPLTIEGDVQGKDKAKYSVSSEGTVADFIVLGTDSYSSLDGGKTWTKNGAGSTDAQDSIKSFISLFDADTFRIGTDDKIQDVGPESINGNATSHYHVISTGDYSLLGKGYTGTSDLWVGDDTAPSGQVVYRMKLDATSSSGNTNLTINYSNFNKAVKIQAPATK